ncbi:MAG: sugar phosphate isomerase/epimerase [Proteobacteria bacterium]|nr:sugar phosphate isomerase/epimerase [Pseudomonadota bacterium]
MKALPIGIISMFYARPFGPEHLALLGRIRSAGLDFIELLVPEPGELDLGATRAGLEAAGLGVVLAARVNASRDLASSEAHAREAGIAYLRACVDAAVDLGAAIVGGPIFGAPLVFAGRAPAPVAEDERSRRVEHVIGGLKQAASYADSRGIKLALEPLNRFETDMVNTARQGVEIIRAVASPALALMLDTFHMNMEENDIAEAITETGPTLIHFQANENHRGFIGKGHVDWKAVARALAGIDYEGPITLEPFRRNDDRPGVPLAQWRPPARNEDADLADSVRLLKSAIAAAVLPS